MKNLPTIVIVGAGFGGLQAAKKLKKASARVIVIDKSNHHLFQPLLYQVATATLSPADIATPIRSILRGQKNTEVMLANVTGVNKTQKKVILDGGQQISYDYLVIATGARHGYFGHENWEADAPGLKSIHDATMVRRKILMAFEKAEMIEDPEQRTPYMNFILVGGGPTGVEMAGAIAELSKKVLASDFRRIDPRSARVVLIEAGPRVLASFPEFLSKKAEEGLKKLGVEVKTNTRVMEVKPDRVITSQETILSQTIIWAAGVHASRAAQWLDVKPDNAGRVSVNPYLNIEGNPEIFVIGDTASCMGPNGRPLPGVSPVAMQQGQYAAKRIQSLLKNQESDKPFVYFDKGNMATIGRHYAVAQIGKIYLSGYVAWIAWLGLHITYLIGFRNKILVLIEWAWAYVAFYRGARLITD